MSLRTAGKARYFFTLLQSFRAIFLLTIAMTTSMSLPMFTNVRAIATTPPYPRRRYPPICTPSEEARRRNHFAIRESSAGDVTAVVQMSCIKPFVLQQTADERDSSIF